MYICKKLNPDQVKDLYFSRMKEDFPPDELRPLSSIEYLTELGSYVTYGYCDENDVIMAYACFAKRDDQTAAMLDYYAVSKHNRGTGIGGKFIADFKTFLPENGIDHVILEVESVESSKNEEQAHTRRRRINFYENNSCIMTNTMSLLYGVEYNVMYLSFDKKSYDDKIISEELFRIYELILSPIIKDEAELKSRAKVWIT